MSSTLTNVSAKNFPHVKRPVMSFDIERSGCYIKENATIAVGIALYIPEKGIFNRRFTFKLDLSETFEDRCIREFWKNNEELLKELTNPEQVFSTWHEFSQAIDDIDIEFPELIICSDNSSYDIAHINYKLQTVANKRGLSYKLDKQYRNIIDTDSFMASLCVEEDDLWVSSKKILEKFNLSAISLHNHFPENDAVFILESFLEVLNYLRARL